MSLLNRMLVPLLLLSLGCGARPEDLTPGPDEGLSQQSSPAQLELALPSADLAHAVPVTGSILLNGQVVTIHYYTAKGIAFVEGDILLDPRQILRAEDTAQGQQLVGQRDASTRWPAGVVPYTIDGSLPDQIRVRDAIDHWQQVTSLRFVPRASETDFVTFRRGDGCSSNVGRIGGQQFVNLADSCSTGAVIHEIGHVIGLWHEQSSDLRDRYVRIRSENIIPGYEANFSTVAGLGAAALNFGSYDYDSIMHYSATAFSRNNRPTIERVDGGTLSGQRRELTLADRRGVEQMYGAFAFSYAGPLSGRTCVRLTEPSDPDTWDDNYLCSDLDYGIRWSSTGPISGMKCTQIREPSDPDTWDDNYVCVPTGSPFVFHWSSTGPLEGMKCIQFYEPADPYTWEDNFLCYEDRRVQWSSTGPVAGRTCVKMSEPSDPDTWDDNYLCTDRSYGLRWSSVGPISGMLCTQLLETSDPHTWDDNFLCTPRSSPIRPSWSSRGPIRGRYCLQLLEPADPDTWTDNYICF